MRKGKALGLVLALLWSCQAHASSLDTAPQFRDRFDPGPGDKILQTESIDAPVISSLWLLGPALVVFVGLSRRRNL